MSRKEQLDSLRAMIPFSQAATRDQLREAIDLFEKGATVDDIKKLFPELLEGDPEYNRIAKDFDALPTSERVELYEAMSPDRADDPTLDLHMELWVGGMDYATAHFEAVKKYFG